jgi:hypothetical protein
MTGFTTARDRSLIAALNALSSTLARAALLAGLSAIGLALAWRLDETANETATVVALLVGGGLAAFFALWFVPAWLVARYASGKGHPFWAFILIGLFGSWVLALILSLALPDRGSRSAISDDEDRLISGLERLTRLRDAGALTAVEFDLQKARLLGSLDR